MEMFIMVQKRLSTTPQLVMRGNNVPEVRFSFHDDTLWVSENHPSIDGRYLTGGPFFKTAFHLNLSAPLRIEWRRNGVTYICSPYTGWFDKSPNPGLDRAWGESKWVQEQLDLLPLGAKGWKRARPGQSGSSIANFAYELRDFPKVPLVGAFKGSLVDLPRNLFNQLQDFRKLGNEYLNVQFGWKPFIGDVQKMYQMYRNIDSRLAQIVRDNGKGIHRKREVQNNTTTSTSFNNDYSFPFGGWSDPPPNWVPGRSNVTETVTNSDVSWFVGRFRYYIPDIGTSQWKKSMTRKLYGATVSPEVLYNALPWSWLMDWFVNVGDVMSNLSNNVDNLTADYAYVMRTRRMELNNTATTSWEGINANLGTSIESIIPAGSATRSLSYTEEIKSRTGATPFGFGLSYDGLSAYQTSILAAIGAKRW